MNQTVSKLNSVFSYFVKNRYAILVWGIVILALFFRLYHFPTRWGIGDDDARDISIAMEALKRGELPLIGSFSSAGPFVFGPLFYWTIMLSYIIFPGVLFAPWIVAVFSSLLVVYIVMLCAKCIGNRTTVVIAGFLAASSPQLILRSYVLGQHSFIALWTTLLLFCYIKLWQTQKTLYALLVGLSIGIALSFHYQALNLLLFIPAVLIIPKLKIKERIFKLFITLFGFLIPSLPLIIWDAQQGFANLLNLLDYFLIAQYRLYVPNSWRIFTTTFLPDFWSFIVGGNDKIGIILLGVIIPVILFTIVRKKYDVLSVIGFIFLFLLFVNRYYKGERSEGYLLYFVPFILLFTALTIQKLYIWNKYIGVFILLFILAGNVFRASSSLNHNNGLQHYESIVEQIEKKYPQQKVSLYDYKLLTGAKSQPLSVVLKEADLTAKNGIPIGVVCNKPTICPPGGPLIVNGSSYNIVSLAENPELQDHKLWVNVNRESMYDDLIGWSKNHSLTASFSLTTYLLERVGL